MEQLKEKQKVSFALALENKINLKNVNSDKVNVFSSKKAPILVGLD